MIRALGPLVLAGAAALLGCGDTTESSAEGRILVTVSTRGAEPQSDEYLVTLNGERPLSITPNGSAVYDEVPEGAYVVHLFSLADNCAVSGSPNSRSVRVIRGAVIEISFSVACSVPVTGGFRIVVTTVGTPQDDDGYQLSVAGTSLRAIEVNAEESYEDSPPARTWSPSRTWRTSATWWAGTLSRIPWCRGRRCSWRSTCAVGRWGSRP